MNKSIQLHVILSLLLLFLSQGFANDFTSGTITATASVTPAIGQMPYTHKLMNETASHDALVIQIPKNSAFHLHVQLDGISPSRLPYKRITQKFNAASDLISISLPTHITKSSNYIITVITSEN